MIQLTLHMNKTQKPISLNLTQTRSAFNLKLTLKANNKSQTLSTTTTSTTSSSTTPKLWLDSSMLLSPSKLMKPLLPNSLQVLCKESEEAQTWTNKRRTKAKKFQMKGRRELKELVLQCKRRCTKTCSSSKRRQIFTLNKLANRTKDRNSTTSSLINKHPFELSEVKEDRDNNPTSFKEELQNK